MCKFEGFVAPCRMCEETGETDAAAVALETNQGAAPAQDEEVEFGYPITCGESKAVLIFKKFVCPGINVKCVKYNNQMISPKQFVHLSGKATLKDWKRAIRLGGVMLRKMMDSGQIDFYQHDTVCTNTCRSTKFDLLISNTRCPLQGTDVPVPINPQGNGGQTEGRVSVEDERPEETAATAEWSSGTVSIANEAEAKKETDSISEETLNFWKGISDVGLIGEVVTNIRGKLLDTLRGLQLRTVQAEPLESDMAVLTNLAQVFGLLDTVKRTLENRRQQMDLSQDQVQSTLTGLEQQLEEQKKQARDWLARTQVLQCVPLSSPSASKPPSKRPRLQRPVSAAMLTTGMQSAPQFTVLSPMTFSSLGQPLAVTGLPLAQPTGTVTLHPLPAGSQLVTRYTATGASACKADTVTLHPSSTLTLLSTAAVQDSGQLGALVSPVELRPVLIQESTEEEAEDESQMHTTVIEIDPAPGDHVTEAMELQLTGEMVGDDDGAVVVQGEMEMVETVQEASGVLVHGDVVEVEEVGEGESLLVHGAMEEVEGGANVVLREDTEEVESETSVVFQGHVEEVEGGASVVLQGHEEQVEGGANMVLHGNMEEVEGGASMVLRGGMEQVSGLQVEQQGQLHRVQIVVIENDVHKQRETK
uniref:Glucocorticoid modulatory element binding protein 1 n=1 Tax=Scleropages formosus TaxID=113540 RepID=A0A8C9SDJ1_SCLFO